MKHTYLIYGKHAALAAISNPKRKIIEILCSTEFAKSLPKHIKFTPTTNLDLKTITYDAPHQGIALKVEPVALYNIPKEITDNPQSKIIILDQVTDPQNLGAILRSAAAFGINAVIYPKNGSATENATVAKAACGALDLVPLIEVVNISATLLELKKEGFWVIGMDGTAKQSISSANNLFDGKLAVVMGSEGAGIRPLVLKTCDLMAKLPINSEMESLNVSNAAAIVMWEVSKG
jgi:23S rRNA (guanosine2251-2'-O)-methyltransferase